MSHHLGIGTPQICLIRLKDDIPPTSTSNSTQLVDWYFEALHVSISSEENPPFKALSYICGAPNHGRHRISIHRRLLDSTPNLRSAISTLQRQEDLTTQCLWIDAICIDQTDHVERAAQVKLMRDLYSCAHRTTAYLGPEEGSAELAISWIERLGGAYPVV
jgi:hypothetical protein